jgi:DNA-binding NtrC family response regulator
MAKRKLKYNILLCGEPDAMKLVRKVLNHHDDVHMQFASTANFLLGRTLFDSPNLVLVESKQADAALPGVVRDFRARFPKIPLFCLATKATHQYVVTLMKNGADDYFLLPVDFRKMNDQLDKMLADWRGSMRRELFVSSEEAEYDFSQIVGSSDALRSTLHKAKKIIASNAQTVLILGETGTGKELLARAVHYNGAGRENPFVDISCSAIPEALLESELFGHERGAFTDARERKSGLFELAGNGSIFLDEIGDIPPAVQSKLLRALETRSMRRVGGVQDIPIKARIIAATSADLEQKTKSGEFRKDLYHRLKIVPLVMPALRNRKEDLPELVEHFVNSFNQTYAKNVKGASRDALRLLMSHPWEGNVRELKHAVERAVLLAEGTTLESQDFDLLSGSEESGPSPIDGLGDSEANEAADSIVRLAIPLDRASAEEIERLLVFKVLDMVGGNKRKAAQILKISRPRLDRILDKKS